MKIAIVGAFSGTHVGGSLARAADRLGAEKLCFDVATAWHDSRVLRAISWRLCDRRPTRLDEFSGKLIGACQRARPDCLIATGSGPLTEQTLRALHEMGIACINYSTDDPWNPTHRAAWHLRALPSYDVVFTPRQSNIDDFRSIGCRDVRYLPFAYDETLWQAPADFNKTDEHDVLFVGGADRDRVAFMSAFLKSGPPIALVGGYWSRYPATKPYALGLKGPEELRALTAKAKVNLCLVRRANRDGHVMRSFEIAAIGGCMLAEDTAEHREIFGEDGECVRYFRTPAEAAARARALLADANERQRLAGAVRARITRDHHTYTDRLNTMLEAATRKVALGEAAAP